MKIKGKTIIELNDAKTGKLIQRTEDNNMLTNALTMFYKQGGITNPSAFNQQTISQTALERLLGGVLLLDTAITEDANIVRVPKNVGMTANGAKGVLNSGNPTELGSWNESESGWQNDGSYKMVWDYTTSQGNGTVACVCLTSLYHGMQGEGNKSLTYKANTTSIAAYNSATGQSVGSGTVIGIENNRCHVWTTTDFEATAEITDNVYSLPVDTVDLRDAINEARLLDTYTVQVPSEISSLSGRWKFRRTFVKNGIAYIYLVHIQQYSFPNGSVYPNAYVVKYNLANHSFAGVIEINGDSEESYCNLIGLSDKWAVLGHVMTDLDNPVNQLDITDDGNIIPSIYVTDLINLEAVDSNVFWGKGCKLKDDAILLPTNSADVISSVINGVAVNDILLQCGNYLMRDPRYIATINNLEAPVTKTADKTMKVTYVIRFDQQEGE